MVDRQFNATCILAVILLHHRDRVDYLQYTEQDMGLLMEERSGSLLGFRCFTSSVVIVSESNDGYLQVSFQYIICL
ncbi:hypothetical protein Pint_30087 [Pistacia integerrima]|uniref:Uncharacterized protein n=1 Tax=Pistacia integerrima TaxID=434235 RepID=A0ACC0WZG6_9ROSI|nr:hypothetical protein Pint_30087 [Pistacia integerrima]